jgi:hypothetical protein
MEDKIPTTSYRALTNEEYAIRAINEIIDEFKDERDKIRKQTNYWSADFIKGYESAVRDLELIHKKL